MDKNKVVVAMSGGVDSSVCAYLLKKQGYDVIGLTMKLENEVTNEAIRDAQKIADKLGIEHHVIDLDSYFQEKVVKYFISEYIKGKTPNPCIECNRHLKFKALLEKAFELDAFYLATGHYAKIEYNNSIGRYLVKKAVDINKDQSYVLYNLKQQQCGHILLPLGCYTKDEIRSIAREAGFLVANKPDSQEICFIKTNYKDFLKKKVPDKIKPGFFVNKHGEILGKHKGLPFYTIGQRRGLGISAGEPLYVISIDVKSNMIVLGPKEDLYVKEFIVGNTNWIAFDQLDDKILVNAKIRYNFKEQPAEIEPVENNKVKVVFQTPQKSVTPGQSAVFYNDDIVIGGGIIL
jgi:tRNA-specific 2-thiouridylase